MLLAAVGIVVAIGAVVVLVRESSTPMARESDAGAEAGPGGDRPGEAGIGHLTWTKSALPDGEHPLELASSRSFEKGVPPFKAFNLEARAAR